jgi:aspartate racemase
MKTVGIIGGIGPESTIDYYRSLLATYKKRSADGSAASIVINSIDMYKMLGMFQRGEPGAVADYLSGEVLKLAGAGADFGLIAANTPHMVFDDIQKRSPIPLISIVQATCDAAKTRGLRRLGLFGTTFTMRGKFYLEVFSREGIALCVPELAEQEYVHDKYLNELGNGIFLPETRERLLAIVDNLAEREKIDGVILGGTELPLILRDPEHHGIPFLDTTQIHVNAAVERMLA